MKITTTLGFVLEIINHFPQNVNELLTIAQQGRGIEFQSVRSENGIEIIKDLECFDIDKMTLDLANRHAVIMDEIKGIFIYRTKNAEPFKAECFSLVDHYFKDEETGAVCLAGTDGVAILIAPENDDCWNNILCFQRNAESGKYVSERLEVSKEMKTWLNVVAV